MGLTLGVHWLGGYRQKTWDTIPQNVLQRNVIQYSKTIDDAEKQFKQRDKDEDGFLSLEEFKSAIKKEEMKEQADKWFKNRDKDGDGKLSFEEFEAGKNQKKKTD